MKVRRVLSDVRWAFRSSVIETEDDIKSKKYKRLCDHCQIINGKNCPRNRQLLQRRHKKDMVAIICAFFKPNN